MPIVTIANLEKSFGQRVIFDHVEFQIDRGERVGLIGHNGSGKTTLFRIITGEQTAEVGSVSVSRNTKIGHLTQDPDFDPANSVMDEAELAFANLHALSHKLRDLEHAMGDHAGEELDRTLEAYQNVQHEFDLAGGYVWRHKLEATLLGVGLERETWEQNVTTLSGGQRSRLALARLLISEPDLLLLDEPTNHLDLAAIEWLEQYLLGFSGAVLLISHDRFLLDRLATRIVWLSEQKLRSYPGNYASFLQQKEVEELTRQRQFQEQQADIEKQKEFIRRFGAGQRAREAKGREKRLTRLLRSDQVIQQVAANRKIALSIDSDQRAGDQVLDVRELSKAYGPRQLWRNVRFHVVRGERIGIIGPNGSGKTTLLDVLLGRGDADGGKIKWGANLNVGYYDQKLDDFDPESTVLEEVAAERSDVTEKQVRDVLGSMLFHGDDVFKPIGLLSGGERARVRLSQLLLDRPNVLLLDEPTNHLDIASREALESSLADFGGTILFVSHDRYFLNKIAKRMLILQPPALIDFSGGYNAWAQRKLQEEAEPPSNKPKSRATQPVAVPKKKVAAKDNPYLRPFGRLSSKDLERQITEAENAIRKCQMSFADPRVMKDAARTRQLQAEHDASVKKLKDLEGEYFARGE